jgi:hypothetical protein
VRKSTPEGPTGRERPGNVEELDDVHAALPALPAVRRTTDTPLAWPPLGLRKPYLLSSRRDQETLAMPPAAVGLRAAGPNQATQETLASGEDTAE